MNSEGLAVQANGIETSCRRVAERLLKRLFFFSKNAQSLSAKKTPTLLRIGAADGRCNTSKAEHADGLSLTAPDQQSRDEPREVLKVADRVLVRRFPGGLQRDGSLAGLQTSEHREQCKANRESRQKGADGSMVHCLVDREGCAVVGEGLGNVHVTTTATAPLSGASAFTTCTFSPNTAAYVVNSQVHSTSRDVARTNSIFHSTPPSPGSPGATEQKEGQTRSMALNMLMDGGVLDQPQCP